MWFWYNDLVINVKFRRYKKADNKQIKHLHRIALESAGAYAKSGNWDQDLDDIPNVYLEFLVGIKEETLIAMGALKKISGDTVEIKRMRVHPDFQRHGLGQKMLDILEKKAKELGFKKIQLDTTVKQIAAQKLYEKNGYLETKRETKGWPLEMIFYQKQLGS